MSLPQKAVGEKRKINIQKAFGHTKIPHHSHGNGFTRHNIITTIQRDRRAYNLTMNKAVDLAQNRPLWRLMSTYGATHS